MQHSLVAVKPEEMFPLHSVQDSQPPTVLNMFYILMKKKKDFIFCHNKPRVFFSQSKSCKTFASFLPDMGLEKMCFT